MAPSCVSSPNASMQSSNKTRFKKLITAVDKSLKYSRSQIDTAATVADYYGEDAAVFEKDNDGMLQDLFETMLDEIHEKVRLESDEFIKLEKVEETLSKLEKIARMFEQRDEQKRIADEQDKESARQALTQVRLPVGVDPKDLVKAEAFKLLQTQVDAKAAELKEMEREIEKMEKDKAEHSQELETSKKKLQAFGRELEKSADVSSMVS